ncbi:MAG: hypothetical protein NTY21_03990 [Actinobacteria bacterium]|nr:hypothetical protein [Actinomycetota bacterium]
MAMRLFFLRKVSISLAVSIPLVLFASPALAATKAGSACTSNGATTTASSIKYVCTKLGKNLIWSMVTSLTPIAASYSPADIEKAVSDSWAQWRANKLKATPKLILKSQKGYSPDWEVVTKKAVPYLLNVLNGNGLKMVPTPFFAFGETEEFRAKAFKEYGCKAPYMKNMEMAIYCAAADIGSGGLRLGRPGEPMANGYKLNDQEIKLLTFIDMHEVAIFYEAQAQYGDIAYDGTKSQIPSWLREGTAQIVALLGANDLVTPGGAYSDFKQDGQTVGPKPEGLCDKDLQDYEGLDKHWSSGCVNSQNFYAVELLVAKHGGFGALYNFDIFFGKNEDWPTDFQKAFGISREDFYKEWYSYLGLAQTDWPSIRAPKPAEHY